MLSADKQVKLFSAGSRLTISRILLILFVVIFTSYWAIRSGRQAARTLDSDFGVYYRAGEDLWAGRPLYNLDHGELLTYKYAPIVAVFWMPLATFDPVTARVVFCLADLAAMAGIFWFTLRCVRVTQFRLLLLGIVFLFTLGHIIAQLHSGQSTSVWILLTLLAYGAMRSDKPVTSGVLLALAVCFKCVPVAFLPLYGLSRHPFRGIVSFGCSLLFLCLAPAMVLGWEENLRLLFEWPHHLIDTASMHQLTRPGNQSVLAQIARWFMSDDGSLLVSMTVVKGMWLVLASVSGAVMLGLIRRTNVPRSEPFHLSLLLIFITLFNPMAWRYNFIALIVPYAYVVNHLLRGKADMRWLLIGGAAFLNTLPLPMEVFDHGGRIWGTLLLLAAVIGTYELKEWSMDESSTYGWHRIMGRRFSQAA